jgi:hypothetical protein
LGKKLPLSASIKLLKKERNQRLYRIALLFFGVVVFSPPLLFLFVGSLDPMLLNIGELFYVIFFISLGLMGFFGGIYQIWFVYKHWKTYRTHRKDWIGDIAGGGLIVVLGLIMVYFGVNRIPNLWIEPDATYASPLIFAPYIILIFPILISSISIIVGVVLLVKNYQSSVTRLLFLSYLTFGGAWLVYLYYNFSFLWEEFYIWEGIKLQKVHFPIDTSVLYLGFFLFFFLGELFLIHGCRRLITLYDHRFPLWFFVSLGIALVATIFLSYTELTHYGFSVEREFTEISLDSPDQLLYLREHSLIFAVVYAGSLLMPLIYSIYLLSKPPSWITQERRRWINRTRISLILLSLYPLVEVVSGLQVLPFFSAPISVLNPAPVKVLLILSSNSLILFSYMIMITSVDDVNKWFFEEIKFRATPELQKINPEIHLAKIWEKIDQMQKEQPLSPKEMTNQKVNEYVNQAKKLITEYTS